MSTTRDRRGRWGFALLVGVAVLAQAALLGGGASGATATAGAPGITATASAAKSVDIDHFAFHPPTLRIGKGGKVAFTNSSDVAHTATRGGSFDTKRIQPGKAKVIQFNQKGTFAYHCKIHTFMKGRIVVE